VYGPGSYHASDLAETNYAEAARALGCNGIRVERPDQLAGALVSAKASVGPTVVDVVVTRDPAKMLPGVDNRAVQVRIGDRPA
jgi:acetolactate synthase-1/2/3 large subunit